jgi:hypothetical protein
VRGAQFACVVARDSTAFETVCPDHGCRVGSFAQHSSLAGRVGNGKATPKSEISRRAPAKCEHRCSRLECDCVRAVASAWFASCSDTAHSTSCTRRQRGQGVLVRQSSWQRATQFVRYCASCRCGAQTEMFMGKAECRGGAADYMRHACELRANARTRERVLYIHVAGTDHARRPGWSPYFAYARIGALSSRQRQLRAARDAKEWLPRAPLIGAESLAQHGTLGAIGNGRDQDLARDDPLSKSLPGSAPS